MKKWNIVMGITVPLLITAIVTPICIVSTRNCSGTISADKETIDKINKLIDEHKPNAKTMYQLVSFLKLTCDIDLEALEAQNNDQIVWDQQTNTILTLKSDNTVSYAPSNYKLNSNKHKIWKMVNYGSSNGKIESFDASSQYGQYLRKISSSAINDTKEITFSCALDVGYNSGFKLTYKNTKALVGDNENVTVNITVVY